MCQRKTGPGGSVYPNWRGAAVSYGYTPFKKGPSVPKNKGKVAVAGGGISGITAAFELDKKGFLVTIYEQSNRLGGRIWDYEGKLISREAIEEELQIIGRLGIKVVYNNGIGREELKSLMNEFDAVYLGTGQWDNALFIHPETFQVLDWPVFAGGRLCDKNDSVIFAVGSGKRAAVSMERYVKKISLTASREREGSFETPVKFDLDDVKPAFRIKKKHEGIYGRRGGPRSKKMPQMPLPGMCKSVQSYEKIRYCAQKLREADTNQ